ncbi:MAG TPA: SUMF1/EgtB/PvdO family nonheme iron enzyme [Bryobacteraceae bacterium]|nr:SUMF1/EgtB/PvdO family nonheme iron enzyme [Bryobacteraceae bacterium]
MTPVSVTPDHRDLGRALESAREETDRLFRLVRPDSFYERPIPERHRILFYVGHLEAFDWNLIGRYALDVPSFHAAFDRLFAFGIDPPPGRLPEDKPSDWPSIAELDRYNQRVRDEIESRLDEVPTQLLHVAIEHRLMHAETFAYILHQLPYERKSANGWGGHAPAAAPYRPSMIDIPEGGAELGLEPGAAFGWDNEFRRHTVTVPAFSIARYKVTNGEYLEFVRAGASPPFFWAERRGRWFTRGMFSETPLPLDHPVYVTFEEAQAYARWRGKSLPTEPEFQRALALAPDSTANLNFEHWDTVPVTAGQVPNQPSQLTGNGWEWTSTPFAPFPGFEPFPFYANYSAPFFDGQHFVLKGASPRTAACFARPSFRNWFRPSYPYIYAGFRLVDK